MRGHVNAPAKVLSAVRDALICYIVSCRKATFPIFIIATDLEPKDLPPDLTLPELQEKLNGHAKGAAGLVGLFLKPQ